MGRQSRPPMTATDEPILFEERQRFRDVTWARFCVLALLLAPLLVISGSVDVHASDPVGRVIAVGVITAPLLAAGLMLTMELTTRVTPAHLEIRYFPLVRKRIPL